MDVQLNSCSLQSRPLSIKFSAALFSFMKPKETHENKLPFTESSKLCCSEKAKKIYLSFIENTEFSDILSKRSGIKGSDFIAAITELELFGFVKAVPVGRYERIK